VRGGNTAQRVITLVVYGDYLCPYCRRLYGILARLRQALGERLRYVFRNFPNEAAHPGATFIARASEAAARQGQFWEAHDWIYTHQPPLTKEHVLRFARERGLDMARFERDLESAEIAARVEEDLGEGRASGVTGTPSFFIDGVRYDGAWDFHSMLEALQLPLAARLQRSARAFANLPASGGLVLLLAAIAALICANTPLASSYRAFVDTAVGIGSAGSALSLSVGAWFSEGLLAIFFLLVGLEIRREMTVGELSDPRAALLPVLAAIGGVFVPAAIYLAFNTGRTARGWSVPTATDIAFTLGILALLGSRVPLTLRVFIAALAVADDVLSVLTLAIFFPKSFAPSWLLASGVALAALFALNRWRVYATRFTAEACMARLPASGSPSSCRRGQRLPWDHSWRKPRPRSPNWSTRKAKRINRGGTPAAWRKNRYGNGRAAISRRRASGSHRPRTASNGPLRPGATTSSCRSSRSRRQASLSPSRLPLRTRRASCSASSSDW
jgi:NhaA family Na+:H+ antiporter